MTLRAADSFVIEAEDYDYESGKHVLSADAMPYRGGAYAGLAGVLETDYHRTTGAADPVYRANGDVRMNENPLDLQRPSWQVDVNYKLTSLAPGDWFNYTRNFPAGSYLVFAALSYRSTGDHLVKGSLARVTAVPGSTDPEVQVLGTFDGPGQGAFGLNAQVPLSDANGEPVGISLSGLATLRFVAESGQLDYLTLVPLPPPEIVGQPADLSVMEGDPASFSVKLSNPAGATYRWQSKQGAQANWVDVPGATAAVYGFRAALGASGVSYRCVVGNGIGEVTSGEAVLTVLPDNVKPALSRAQSLGNTNVLVVFSEPVDPVAALSSGSYRLDRSVKVTQVLAGGDSMTVRLVVTPPLQLGLTYTLTVNGVKDLAVTPNTILPNSTLTFLTFDLTVADIGNPPTAGSIQAVADGFDVTGSGVVGDSSDQCQFSHTVKTGDFDIAVRLAGVSASDVWAMAGLVAREDLSGGSRYVGAMATPSMVGCVFQARSTAGQPSMTTGSFPANFPEMWLRLQRVGDVFVGYAGYDGRRWTQLGVTTMPLPATLKVGYLASSRDAARPATASFRDPQPAISDFVGRQSTPFEPPGPSTRRTGLVITEIMYNPAARADLRNLEFLEIYNSNPMPEDISGHRLSGDIDYTFPAGTILSGGSYLVLARAPADIRAVYGITNVAGPYTNALKSSGLVRLRSEADAILLEVPYESEAPWPVGASGTGHSIVLARPSYGEADGRAWALSDRSGGSPGMGEAWRPGPLRGVVINEFLAHTDPPLYDYIELFNRGAVRADLSGCILTDDLSTNRFVIPSGTYLDPGQHIVFDELKLGFRLDAGGETIHLFEPGRARVLDAVRFGGQENGLSMGRHPDGEGGWYPLRDRTPGGRNGPIRVHDIAINEIMYHPISDDDADQYVELLNQGGQSVDLSGWRFVAGIDYVIPTNTVLEAGGYLVVGRNATNLLARYPQLNAQNTVGDFQGRLSKSGERIALARPEWLVNTNTPGVTKTNLTYVIVDEVSYGTGGRWGEWADGGGSSLELVDARSNHRLASNWADSDESHKAPWTTIEATDVLDNGAGYSGEAVNRVQIGLLGAGECLIDDVEARAGVAGPNLVANPDFEGGRTSWRAEGDHSRSTLETTEGHQGSRSFHLRASDTIWTGANYVSGTLTGSVPIYDTGTLRLQARWLRGWPEILMRVNGNWMEATGRLLLPTNLGSPGLPNSRALGNAPPAIAEVTHTPSLPADGEPLVVTAQVEDSHGVQSVSLEYRVESTGNTYTVPMVDDGTGGDRWSGDGIYSARVPGLPGGTVMAFKVRATDAASAASVFPSELGDQGPTRECVVLFGDNAAASAFGSYHYWLTPANINRWGSLPDLSNEPIDGTWVCGSRVIYNMYGHFAGSPYHQQFDRPNGSYCHYNLRMPKDDLFLGTTSFNKIHAPGNGPFDDSTLQREQTAYWMVRQLGLPWNYRRYVAMFVNGSRRGTLMEDTQVPGKEVVAEHFPDDSDGTLYKLQPWFEFASDGRSFDNQSWCTLNDYQAANGGKKLARYRWNYLPRAVGVSANNYTNVFALIDAANRPDNVSFRDGLSGLADMDQWMRTFAIEHAVGNWDAVGSQNAQNMYGYKPEHGRWAMLIWDYNIVLGNSGSWGPGENLFAINWQDYPMQRIFSEPVFRRSFWRALKEIALGPMNPARVRPVMEARYASFRAENIAATSPESTLSWISSAASSILAQVAGAGGNGSLTLQSPSSLTTSSSLITLYGSAPFDVESILVNGRAYPVTWNSDTDWSLTLAVSAPQSTWNIQGLDRKGRPAGGFGATVQVTYTGPVERAQDHVVINEIMYNPLAPDAAFIEIHNTSSAVAFDLSGCRLEGADFTFPAGSIVLPGGFLVIANDAEAFAATYGGAIPVAGVFSGKLKNTGETLRLVVPGLTPETDVVLDEVTYASAPPWPGLANGYGPSLQLIDPAQDNNRVANWATAGDAPPAVEWKFASVTGTATSSRLYLYLQSKGDVYLDDLWLVSGAVAEAGQNLIVNGDFEAPLDAGWNLTGNTAGSGTVPGMGRGGSSALHLVCNQAGTSQGNSIWQDTVTVVTNDLYTLSYWYRPSTNGSGLVVRLSGSTASVGIRSAHPIAPDPTITAALFTPGAPNSTRATLAPIPALWLNEVQPLNGTGLTDNTGQREPWLELYNSGTGTLDLSGFYLSDTPTNLTRWPLPSQVLQPGEFWRLWADGHPERTASGHVHAGFRLASTNGTVLLSQVVAGATNVVDYLHYPILNVDRSYGAFPDGTPTKRRTFYSATPAAPNNPDYPAAPITINEWMAANTKSVADPADGLFPDWFELHNAGPVPVDLTGYRLADDSTEFIIPAGWSVPAEGFLVVFADNDPLQNNTQTEQLHVSFKLSQSADRIVLMNPSRVVIDRVDFVNQVADVSEGRWPDGNAARHALAVPTPGEPNIRQLGSNHAPTLTAPAHQAVYPGAALRFQAFATDDDPGQSLTFSLAEGAPPGMLIQPQSGIVTWTAPGDYPVGSFVVTLRVVDDGLPPLETSRSVTVEVIALEPPGLPHIDLAPDGALRLSWASQPGGNYRVEYRDSLTTGDWLDFGDYPATGAVTEAVDDTVAATERYYRVRRLP